MPHGTSRHDAARSSDERSLARRAQEQPLLAGHTPPAERPNRGQHAQRDDADPAAASRAWPKGESVRDRGPKEEENPGGRLIGESHSYGGREQQSPACAPDEAILFLSEGFCAHLRPAMRDARCARRNTIPRSCLCVLRAYRLARSSCTPLRDPLPPRRESGRGSLTAPRTPPPCAAAARSGRSRRRKSRRRRDGRRRRGRDAPDASGRPCLLPPER